MARIRLNLKDKASGVLNAVPVTDAVVTIKTAGTSTIVATGSPGPNGQYVVVLPAGAYDFWIVRGASTYLITDVQVKDSKPQVAGGYLGGIETKSPLYTSRRREANLYKFQNAVMPVSPSTSDLDQCITIAI